MAKSISEKSQATQAQGRVEPGQTRGSGKWLTAFVLVLIAAFFFGSVIINRIAMTQG